MFSKKKKPQNKSCDEMIDVEIKRDINLQSLEEDKISLYDAKVNFYIRKEFIKNKK